MSLIEDDLGTDVAAKVARYLVMHLRRSGDQAQFSIPLQFQSKADNHFSGLTTWILDNLTGDLSVQRLAEYCLMSERNFCRRFRQETGESPGRYVEQLRLDYARHLLEQMTWPIGRIAEACGYHSNDVFRRAFERKYQLTPNTYRARFAVSGNNASSDSDI